MSQNNIKRSIAVIDTETNWHDQVMSIGIAIADRETYELRDTIYYVLIPEIYVGGMYEGALKLRDSHKQKLCSRGTSMEHLRGFLRAHNVEEIFAYNARFDCQHMPELKAFRWFDIMRLAAYRQYNPSIPANADCCKTGRLKRCYGVEPTLQRLSGDVSFRETHNALYDALDELRIMQLLKHPVAIYECGRIC